MEGILERSSWWNPSRDGGFKASRDWKGDGHCQHSDEGRQKLGVTPLRSSIIRRSFRAWCCNSEEWSLYFLYGELFPVIIAFATSITLLLILQMIFAATSRSRALLGSVCGRHPPRTAQSARHYTKGQKQEEPVIPSMNELLSKKSIKSAWAGERLGDDDERNWKTTFTALSTTKKLLFGVFVLVGGAGEYALMKKYILEPAKERKRLSDQESKAQCWARAGRGWW